MISCLVSSSPWRAWTCSVSDSGFNRSNKATRSSLPVLRRAKHTRLCVATCRFNEEESAHVDLWMPNELFRLLAKQEWIALPRLASAVSNLCLVDSPLLRSELWKLWIPTVNSLPVSCRLLFFFVLFFKADSFLCIAVAILMPVRQALFSVIKEDSRVSWDWFHVQYLLWTKLCV